MSYRRCPDCSSRIVTEKACHSCGKNFHASSGGGGSGGSVNPVRARMEKRKQEASQLEKRRREILDELQGVGPGARRVHLRSELDDVKSRLRRLEE